MTGQSITPPQTVTGVRWYKWPLVWFRTEKFWQEVMTRFLAGLASGLIVVAVIWLLGVTTGVVNAPPLAKGFFVVLIGVTGVIVWLALVATTYGAFGIRKIDSWSAARATWTIAGCSVLMLLSALGDLAITTYFIQLATRTDS